MCIIFRVPLSIYTNLKKSFKSVFFPVLGLLTYFSINWVHIHSKFSLMQKNSKLILEDLSLVQEAVTWAGLIFHLPKFQEFCCVEILQNFVGEILFVKSRLLSITQRRTHLKIEGVIQISPIQYRGIEVGTDEVNDHQDDVRKLKPVL